MKKFTFFFFLFFLSFVVDAQVLNPVKWSFGSENAGNGYFNIVFTAAIENKWHLYGQDIPADGPVPTSFTFNPSDNYELIGKVKEITKGEEKFDESFQMKVKMFSNKAKFVQKIKPKTSGNIEISGSVEFMCCDDNRCLPPKTEKFLVSLNVEKFKNNAVKSPGVSDETVLKTDSIKIANISTGKINEPDRSSERETIITENSKTDNTAESNTDKSLWGFILLAFVAGIAGVFTPCVYPMMPLTVAFFMRGEEKRSGGILNGIIFGLSIVMIYTLLGAIVAITKSGTTLTTFIATNWIANLVFFLLFMFFALWFFGMYEIVLPGSLSNKLDQKADKGGKIGAFFMALTLIIVSFSCTGPFIGAILVGSTTGSAIKPVIGMFAYAVAFALPFVLLAISPELLKKLSKSGSWLNTVKVVFAFILFAFALKFLSVVDTTNHLNILSREIYLSLWIVIFGMLGFYLIGKIKFPHDGDLHHIPVPRFIIAVIVFSFVIYMIPGLFGVELKEINALLPPSSSKSASFISPVNKKPINKADYLCGTPKYSDFLALPYGLPGYFDYKEGITCAIEKNKPVFLDIKGHACANCKKMETRVFSDVRVQEKLREDFIIIALYVDDKFTLPESEWLLNAKGEKVKTNMGEKNLDYEIKKFNINTQPLYAILDHKGDVMGKPMETNLNVNEFLEFLEKGKKMFDEKGKL